jgi:hypothetical protein
MTLRIERIERVDVGDVDLAAAAEMVRFTTRP